ncbi:MAG: DUF1127 domain-containing protein [Alphaproteobacteria bacterium]
MSSLSREVGSARVLSVLLSSVRLVQRSAALIRLWSDRAEGRRALACLDERQLRDIGLDPVTVERETAKPFWRA